MLTRNVNTYLMQNDGWQPVDYLQEGENPPTRNSHDNVEQDAKGDDHSHNETPCLNYIFVD